jgi:xylulokinase
MALYLGLDSSTQGLTAIAIEGGPRARRVVHRDAINFDAELPHYGTHHGTNSCTDPSLVTAPPAMWAEALDRMMARLAESGVDWSGLAAISGSAQQHGSVYLSARARALLPALDPREALSHQVREMLSRDASPIWMDSSTTRQCAEITASLGGDAILAKRTGSRAFERFTGPQIRKFWQQDPEGYAATDRIHLVSSFMASLLVGGHAPLDPGDASGMNLMDLATEQWWPEAVEATAPGLAPKLPAIVKSWRVVGTLSPYWRRYGLPDAKVVAWSGDNPCSLIGTGLVDDGLLAVSLGTSDTVFGHMNAVRHDPALAGHVFGAPTGAYMGLTCFRNGSLARERVRDRFGLDWNGFVEALHAAPPGNRGRLLLPWFEPEITPPVALGDARTFGVAPDDAPANVRGLVEAQLLAARRHSTWIASRVEAIHATGGAAVNQAILQVMADVFGADVYRFDVSNSAALGAALRACHADVVTREGRASWQDIVSGFAEPMRESRIVPDRTRHEMYEALLDVYGACEAFALGRGADPAPQLAAFRSRFGDDPPQTD